MAERLGWGADSGKNNDRKHTSMLEVDLVKYR